MVFLDTDLLVGFLRGDSASEAKLRELEESGEEIRVTAITAYELLKGASSTARQISNMGAARLLLRAFTLVELGMESCDAAAKVYSELRRKGSTIGEFDILIAGTVIATGDRLVTRDSHFSAVKGLKVEGW